ncbi:MAG: hypothetical protein EOP06_13580 [Proteobacteria bacterium]|nr:MAG: hypothetical protein EOP06_13580 [Pseudomonadota bacterium]
MKFYLPLLALSSILTISCSVDPSSKNSAISANSNSSLPDIDKAFDARIASAINAVNANEKSEVYSAKGFDKAVFEKAVAEYMACEGIDRKSSLLKTRWEIVRIVDHGTYSAIILNFGYIIDANTTELQPDVWEVFAISNDSNAEVSSNKCENIQVNGSNGYVTPKFLNFSKAFPSPKVLRASFENQPAVERPGMFYAEITHPTSIVDVLKSVYTGSPFSRLEVDLAKTPNGKLSWDPTPGRTWSVVNPHYDLSRGALSIEIGDGFADLLDRDYAGAAKGANYKLFPWSAGFVRQILIDGKFVEVLSPDLAKERVPQAPSQEEGGIGTGGGFGIGL